MQCDYPWVTHFNVFFFHKMSSDTVGEGCALITMTVLVVL